MPLTSYSYFFQAYHSQFNSESNRLLGNMALLPLRTSFKGPAPKTSKNVVCWHDDLYPFSICKDDETDIIDETLSYFKANVFFKSYEVKVSECLLKTGGL